MGPGGLRPRRPGDPRPLDQGAGRSPRRPADHPDHRHPLSPRPHGELQLDAGAYAGTALDDPLGVALGTGDPPGRHRGTAGRHRRLLQAHRSRRRRRRRHAQARQLVSTDGRPDSADLQPAGTRHRTGDRRSALGGGDRLGPFAGARLPVLPGGRADDRRRLPAATDLPEHLRVVERAGRQPAAGLSPVPGFPRPDRRRHPGAAVPRPAVPRRQAAGRRPFCAPRPPPRPGRQGLRGALDGDRRHERHVPAQDGCPPGPLRGRRVPCPPEPADRPGPARPASGRGRRLALRGCLPDPGSPGICRGFGDVAFCCLPIRPPPGRRASGEPGPGPT